jgi:predicted nuclease of predicted toxin-antitoxin system
VKLLLDTCVWAGAAEALLAAGHDVRWVGESGADPGDEAIMGMAYAEDRVLVTLDKDFGSWPSFTGSHTAALFDSSVSRRAGKGRIAPSCWNDLDMS